MGQGVLGFILAVGMILLIAAYNYFQKMNSVVADSSIIAGGGLLGSPNLVSMSTGKLAGYDYNMLTNDTGRVMLVVTLPQNTRLHLVAIGDKSNNLEDMISGTWRKWLEPVSLEGNFPDRFRMYVSKDRQMEVRQLFEPDVMMRFYEFCRTYDFELIHESMYFSLAGDAHDTSDSTTMISDAEAFLLENTQFLSRLSS